MKKIVSANYRDRQSSYPWLIREEGSPIKSAKAFKSVKAKGFRFGRSFEEQGFGCSVVAFCDKAEGFDPEPTQVKLKFDGRMSFLDEEGNEIEKGKSLKLNEDRSILATV